MPKNTVERRIDGKISTAAAVVSGGGSGGGGGGVTDHGALTGLSDDDHPQYLTDARGDALFLTPAEGNAAYVPLARSVSAGDGMTGGGALSGDITLAVGAGNGIAVAADSVAVKLHATLAGLVADANGLRLGTPADATVSSTSVVTATSHAHAVAASGDVHLGEDSLLRSVGGKLRLQNIEVGPNATPILVTVDTAGMERVGINCQPDPQFALDVYGPARASLFIGPHAIQLKDALLIAHFDSGEKGNFVSSGETNGHKGQIGTAGQTSPWTGKLSSSFATGKFGHALQVARPTTNYVIDPCFVETSGWSAAGGTGLVAGSGRISTDGYVLGSSYLLKPATGSTSFILNDSLIASVANGATVWAQCRVRRTNFAKQAFLGIRVAGLSTQAGVYTPSVQGDEEWEYLQTSWTNNTGVAKVVGMLLGNAALDTTSDVLFDAVQLEVGAFPTPFCSAYLYGINDFVGGVGAFPSTRPYNYLTYPSAGNIKAATGTVMMWAKLVGLDATTGHFLCGFGPNVAGQRTEIIVNSSGALGLMLNGAYRGANFSFVAAGLVGKWVHIAATWDALKDECNLYLNGVGYAAPASMGGAPLTLDTLIGVGKSPGLGTIYNWNGWIDDFAITGQAMSADEIRAVYESNAPVFAETSTWAFRATPKGLVWADENGLWARDAVGQDIFGVYGGEASTYAWGGQTLNRGDVLIGNGSKYVWWDNYAAQLKIAGTLVACDGVFSGSLSAASGTFAGSLTAASGNITGTLAISGAGKITAGSNVTLDATNGLTLKPLSAFNVSAAVGFVNAAGTIGNIYANQNSTSSGALYIESQYAGSAGAGPQVRLRAGASSPAEFILEKSIAGLVTASLNGALYLPNNTASVPALTGTRTNSGVFFVAGASSAAAQVAVSVDGVLQVEVNKGFTKFGGTVVGSTTAAASTSAFVYANGKSSYPGFEQNTSGGVILSAPSGQSIDARVNSASILNISSTQVQLSMPINNLTCNNDPGTQGTGIVAFTNVWGSVSSGVGSIKMGTTSAANNVGWLKVWREGTAYKTPLFAWAA